MINQKEVLVLKLYAYSPWVVLIAIGLVNFTNQTKIATLISVAYFVIIGSIVGLVKWTERCQRKIRELR
jgi:hypothetical protein